MSDRDAQPVVSCVVPCKGAGTLRDALASLHDQDLAEPYDVVVVDGWWDDAVASLCAEFPRVRLVRSRDKLVPGPARNLGVAHASSEYLAFTDADCVVERGFLSAAKRALDAGVRLAGGPVLDALPWWRVVARADNLSQFADFPPTRPGGRAAYFPGCNMAMRKADFLAVGGFPDTGMPAGEDTLLCVAASERWPGEDGVRFVPDMRVRHRGRSDLSGFLAHQEFFGYCRGTVGMRVPAWQRAWGRRWWMVPAVTGKRYVYMLQRTAQWHPAGLAKAAALSPLVVWGMFRFAVGFRRGCLEAARAGRGVGEEGSDG